ncbi:zinc ABC transporter substrate-binding protein [Aliiroseovarius sp. F20344]|uniref:zinc ABC transporter substrate-binding protein n=1 Tax=Aliiroseovarius sp. F20344 TaxID=2926414 RepID=UPI001FF63F68|nr:zinc ABC transporter substrate-binding protein [Aliiroseovarius sp. F20344]MCK0143208.1 zinc ABC transporter substrate-binding protein [Aliiroseovarius sp. F20344]
MTLLRTATALCLCPTVVLADPPKVVADFAPIHSLAAQVMNGVDEPDLLLPQGADPHGFQMRPSQMRALTDADLLLWVGPSMSPWLERAIESAAPDHSMALLSLPETVKREGGHDHDHGDDHDDHDDHSKDAHDDHDHEQHDEHADHVHEKHDEHADHDHDAHDEHDEHDEHKHDEHAEHAEGVDPHAWLSPKNAQIWLEAIAEELSEIDPGNAKIYHDNAHEAQEKIAALDERIQARLAPVKGKGFVLFHDAFGYFSDYYELNNLASIRETDAAPPSAAQLAEISEKIEHGEVACIFSEPAQGESQVLELAKSAGTGTAVLDPSGASQEIGPMLYENLLWTAADTIATCLEGK